MKIVLIVALFIVLLPTHIAADDPVKKIKSKEHSCVCLLYTSDAADE